MTTAVKSSFLPARRAGGGGASASGGPGHIDRFLDAVWMERGLSPNTLAAYRADLSALERLLEELSFEAPEVGKQTITITPDYVRTRLREVLNNEDLSKYIL